MHKKDIEYNRNKKHERGYRNPAKIEACVRPDQLAIHHTGFYSHTSFVKSITIEHRKYRQNETNKIDENPNCNFQNQTFCFKIFITTDLEVGVLLLSAVLLIGTSTLASGK